MKATTTPAVVLGSLALPAWAAPTSSGFSLLKRNIPYDIVRIVQTVIQWERDPGNHGKPATVLAPDDFCTVTTGTYTEHTISEIQDGARDNQCYVAVQCNDYFKNYTQPEYFTNTCCLNCESPQFLDDAVGGFSLTFTLAGTAGDNGVSANHNTQNQILTGPILQFFGMQRNLTNEDGTIVDPLKYGTEATTTMYGCGNENCWAKIMRKGKGYGFPGDPYGNGLWNNGATAPISHTGATSVTWDNCKPKDPHAPINYWDTTGTCEKP